jgi:hypothetical protein
MNINLVSLNWNALLSSAVGVLTTGVVAAYFLGWKLPVLSSDRAALLMVAALGFVMCMLGMGKIAAGLGWPHPISVVGVLAGLLIILIVVAAVAGWRIPPITSDRAALLAIVALGALKWAVGLYSHIFLKL